MSFFRAIFIVAILSLSACAIKNNTSPYKNKTTPPQIIKANKMVTKSYDTKRQNNLIKDKKPANKKALKSYAEYKIKLGDTLSNIAQKFEISESCIVKVNKIKEKDWIIAGQVLKIPNDNCTK